MSEIINHFNIIAEKSYYYLSHPDHLERFLVWFSDRPYLPEIPKKVRYELPSGKFVIKCLGWAFLGFIVVLLSGFKKDIIIIASIPLCLLLFAYIYSFFRSISRYFNGKKRFIRASQAYPQKQIEWLNKLQEQYIKYRKYLVSKVKYRYNPETQKGASAEILRKKLFDLDIKVKQEADLQWKGLNLFPQRPWVPRGWRRDEGWYEQFKYTADFIYTDVDKGIMLDIEIDEPHHFDNEVQIKKDKQRNNIFLCSGWSVIRFKSSEVRNNPEKCAKNVKQTILQIEEMHSTIQLCLEQLKTINLSNEHYSLDDYSSWIKRKIKKERKDFCNYIDYEYNSAVDYSIYQITKYMADYDSFKT